MTSIGRSLAYALANVLHPRMIWLMVWPLVLALGIWGTLAIVFWTQLALAIAEWLQQGLAQAPFVGDWDFTTATVFLAKVLILVMLVPLILRGAGRLSLDAVVSQWFKTEPHPEPVADLVAWGLAGVAVGLPLAMLLPTFGFALAAAGIVMLGLSRLLHA